MSELRDQDAASLANGPSPSSLTSPPTRFSSVLRTAELKLPPDACTLILRACNASSSSSSSATTTAIAPPPSHAASTLLANRAACACGVRAIDDLIRGGLKRGEVLEISGPPGSGKTQLALEFVKHAVGAGDEVLVMGTPRRVHTMPGRY